MPTRPTGPSRLVSPAAIFVSLLMFGLVSACDRQADPPAAVTAVAPPTAIARDLGETAGTPAADAAPAAVPTLARVAPEARQAITYSLTQVDLPAGLEGRPGPWSPDGSALVAYFGGADARGSWSGRLWIVDAETGRPRHDSGDVQADPAERQAAAWLADGRLALARADGMFVDAQGDPLDSPAGLDGQIRQVFADPTGQRILATGPDGAWIVQPGGAARFLSGWPPAGQANWSWSPDGTRILLGHADGRYALIDAQTGESIRIADGFERPGAEGLPAPRWLADGRVLLAAARELRYQDGSEFDHRLVDPASTAASSLTEFLGIPRNPLRPERLDRWVSPRGRYLLYPEYAAGESEDAASARATWLLDLEAGRLRSMAPLDGRPHWSPPGDRFAVIGGSTIDLYDPEMGPVLSQSLPEAAIEPPAWSPDGRWLLLRSAGERLWLLAADGSAEPLLLAEGVTWPPAPTWSPASPRFAMALAGNPDAPDEADAAPRLLLVTVGLAPRP